MEMLFKVFRIRICVWSLMFWIPVSDIISRLRYLDDWFLFCNISIFIWKHKIYFCLSAFCCNSHNILMYSAKLLLFCIEKDKPYVVRSFASLFHEFHLFPSGQRAQTSLYECSHHTTCLELVCSEWLSTENYKNKYSLWKLFNVP